MPIQAVVREVEDPVGEPLEEGGPGVVEDLSRLLEPGDPLPGLPGPESLPVRSFVIDPGLSIGHGDEVRGGWEGALLARQVLDGLGSGRSHTGLLREGWLGQWYGPEWRRLRGHWSGRRRPDDGGRRPEAGDRRPETGDRRADTRCPNRRPASGQQPTANS